MREMLMHRLPSFEPSRDNSTKIRNLALDGLRGWAALSVVCFHLLWETFGEVEPSVRNPFTAFLLDGSLAVSLFFVLSGEALSSSYFAGGGRRAVVDSAIKRYPRLVIPVLAASVITALLIHAGADYSAAAGEIVRRPDWLGSYVVSAPGLLGTLRFALFEVFTSATAVRPFEALIPFLWTMRIELLGSVLVFALLLLCHGRRYGWHVTLAVFAVLMLGYILGRPFLAGNLACFIAGLIFAKLRYDGLFDQVRKQPRVLLVSSGGIVALLSIDGVLHSNGFYDARSPLFAMLLVIFISCNRVVNEILCSRISQFLGRISFPIFLIQFPVIISFTSFLIILFAKNIDDTTVVIAIFILSLIACLFAALLFEPIELLTKNVCARFSRFTSTKY